jgi:hypothetical protein
MRASGISGICSSIAEEGIESRIDIQTATVRNGSFRERWHQPRMFPIVSSNPLSRDDLADLITSIEWPAMEPVE